MIIEFDEIAKYMGELYAAARHDHATANPADVGMNGVSIVGWREAYAEGCKDMAEGIVSRVPEAQREQIKKVVLDAFNDETARLKTANAEPTSVSEGSASQRGARSPDHKGAAL